MSEDYAIPEWCRAGAECDFYVPSLGLSDRVEVLYALSPYSVKCKSLTDGKVRTYGMIDLAPTKKGKAK